MLYASKWPVSTALLQEHDHTYWPVTFTSRSLKPNAINYVIIDEEVLDLLRILAICYSMLASRESKFFTRVFDVSLVSAIVWAEWQVRKVDCVTVELDAGGEEMREGQK